MQLDPATILYFLQALQPVFDFFSSFVGIILQFVFMGLDLGSFLIGFA